jgi:hypothetical protein
MGVVHDIKALLSQTKHLNHSSTPCLLNNKVKFNEDGMWYLFLEMGGNLDMM